METKYAVALLKGDEERILAIFDSREEADAYGQQNYIPHQEGLEYCFSALFRGDLPQGNAYHIHTYYNA